MAKCKEKMKKEKRLILLNGNIFLPNKKIVKGNILIAGRRIKEVYFNNKKNNVVKNIDLTGKMVIPGFIDAHTHLLQEGIKMMRPDLSPAEGPEDVLTIIKEALKDYERGDVIVASDFDESKWKTKKIPEKKVLDMVSPANPLIIRRICGHIAVANSLALEKISRDWKRVNRKTGIMKEDVPLNLSRIFPPRKGEIKEGLKKAVKKANSLGITSIHEIARLKHISFYEEIAKRGELTLNVRLYIPVNDLKRVRRPDFDFKQTTFGGVKIFADGSIGARTAANTFPYNDSPGNRGILIYRDRELREFIKSAEDLGIQLIVHAIGNRAIEQVINMYEEVIKDNNPLRHRIEHCELINMDDLERMKRLRIVASMQPNFILEWSGPGDMYENALGARFKTNNPLAILKKYGITVAFGSDCMPISPILGIEGATNGPFESQRITKEDAIYYYTRNSAFAGFSLEREGEIMEGKEANLVVLDRDLKKIYLTFFQGKCVYSAYPPNFSFNVI